jgi:acyl-CoA synthetase (AMP-forming)/AMP-acid ligase II
MTRTSLYTVHRTVAVNALRYPERLAVSDGHAHLTYRELDARASQLAHELIARCVTAGVHIAILAGNTVPHVVALLAAAKAGAISVVLDMKWVACEINQAVALFECRAMFIDKAHLSQIDGETRRMVNDNIVEADFRSPDFGLERIFRERPAADPAIQVCDDDIFMLMLTSGTTGRPKGCIKTHESYLHSCMINFTSKRMVEGERELLVVPIYYNSGRSSLITQLCFAGSVYLRDRFEPEPALQMIQNEKITCLALAPNHCNELLHCPSLQNYDLSSLRVLRKAGLPFQKRLLQSIMEKICPEVFQAYGGTEFSEATVLKPEEQLSKIGSAGLPVWGTEVRVVGRDNEVLPPGTEGIICVRSPSVCDGYFNDRQETEQAFVDGWYRSGDLGFIDEDGYLYISGREKNLIKTGGINVAPAEIEDIILTFPEVSDVSVVGVEDPRWGTAIKAIVALRPGTTLSEDDLLSRCAENLSRYKLPKSIEFVERIPRNALGKLASKT